MGPDPVLSKQSDWSNIRCTVHLQTTFEEAFSKHRCHLTESGTCMRMFHVAQVHIHCDISRDSDVQPMLKNLVMPLPNYDGSDVVLFPDETLQNLRFISGSFSLSNSRCRGKVGIDTIGDTTRLTLVVRNNVKPATPFE